MFLGILNSPGEWGIVLVLILLLFGASKIPQLARSLGRAKGEFEKGKVEGDQEAAAAMPQSDEERRKTLQAAEALGIPTEGRSYDEIRADVRQKMA